MWVYTTGLSTKMQDKLGLLKFDCCKTSDINFVIISLVRLVDNIILSRHISTHATITRGTELYKHIIQIINSRYLNPEVAKTRYSCPFLSEIDVFQQFLVLFQLQFDQEK